MRQSKPSRENERDNYGESGNAGRSVTAVKVTWRADIRDNWLIPMRSVCDAHSAHNSLSQRPPLATL